MSDPPPAGSALPPELDTQLRTFGAPRGRPPRPVLRGPAGTLLTLPYPGAPDGVLWRGLLLGPDGPRRVGPELADHHCSTAHGLTGPTAEVADLLAAAIHTGVERAEEADLRLADLQEQGRSASFSDIADAQRSSARLRGDLGRLNAALDEAARRTEPELAGLSAVLPALVSELDRGEQLLASAQQGLSDLVMLRNTEESNRLSATANALGATSNRIAELQNISNIRMLGITYIALILALIGAVVLIPNTGATILGMPSAGWVPGLTVDVVLFALTVIPLFLVFRQRWVRELLRGMGTYEGRTGEGLRDLPERVAPADGAAPEPLEQRSS
ncbi:MAG: hypothetical protein ACYDFT_06020 [Thermoplasmata archaeon]